ncbi:MAG TPA: TetR/AcrR family transcriptional regulator [Yinghuangia sp.]|uniref:TetR/AcrR family transcriptional regulator n=1 Tax=Yinghuangia sp. YIM S10712 TaxID=3436930 RepID=UPI002CF81AC7|nr:TetR/AcrR family transcriptional regulator [Yinghuangia sp.]
MPEPSTPTSVWLRPERSGRGPAPTFDRDRLAAAGITVADAGGLAAVTMRAVADELGTAPASLYRYVATRDDLVELMADRVAGEIAYRPTTGRPLDDVLHLAHESRRAYLRHPWLLDVAAPRTPLGPRAVDYLDRVLAAFADHPADARTKLEAVGVMNAVVASLTRAELDRRQEGRTIPQDQRAQHAYLTHVVAEGRHPHLAAALTAGKAPDDEAPDSMFTRIVSRVVRGLLDSPTHGTGNA